MHMRYVTEKGACAGGGERGAQIEARAAHDAVSGAAGSAGGRAAGGHPWLQLPSHGVRDPRKRAAILSGNPAHQRF